MPNWCGNTLVLEHENPEKITQAVEAFKKGEMLQSLVPNPSGEWNYDWCVSNWGTKWDIGGETDPIITNPNMATFMFDSAWAPPIQAYQSLLEQDYRVYAMYYESGMCFAGIWDNGDDDYYEFSDMDSQEVADTLPPELDNEFSISEYMAEYEADNEEELTHWYKDGVEETGLVPHQVKREEND